VVKVILGDMLHLNYILDPAVQGGVTMQTAAPISRADLLPTLETLLRMNNATLVKVGGQYQVVPVLEANRGLLTPRLAEESRPLPAGHNLLIRPLHHVSAEEMSEILKPLVRDNSILRVDTRRNLLVLAGTARELEQVLATIDTFDVNWLRGMSIGFFPLENANLGQVQKELDAVLGSEAGKALGGLVRITPVPSANGFLVVSRQREYLSEVGKWIRRFDRLSQASEEQRIFVYRVRNGKAEELAELLNELFGASRATRTPGAAVAPGRRPVALATEDGSPAEARAGKAGAAEGAPGKAGSGAGLVGDVRVVADSEHNTLLILATARDYRRMLDTLQKLDIIPLQVHIEATIVEVLLKGKLKYGISWFFKGGAGGYDSVGGVGGSTTGIDLTGGIQSLASGFNWSLIDSTGAVRAVLNAFANDSLVNVLSAPSVMVLDNQEAVIQVGDEVPTLTQRQGTEGGAVIESVSYRNTGIILKVKPRVNPGGLVTMEVSQEVSAVADTEVATNQPTIQTRRISSTVAVQSGQTVVLGGLIRDKRTNAEGGVPVLYKLPVVGGLFGEKEKNSERVELVVVLTPRVITSAEDALHITRDFRTRMQGLKKEFLQEAGILEQEPVNRD
jgi:general secretion pathway protein D